MGYKIRYRPEGFAYNDFRLTRPAPKFTFLP